jgi:hypothetical protein
LLALWLWSTLITSPPMAASHKAMYLRREMEVSNNY